jgi:hypothetical protein
MCCSRHMATASQSVRSHLFYRETFNDLAQPKMVFVSRRRLEVAASCEKDRSWRPLFLLRPRLLVASQVFVSLKAGVCNVSHFDSNSPPVDIRQRGAASSQPCSATTRWHRCLVCPVGSPATHCSWAQPVMTRVFQIVLAQP